MSENNKIIYSMYKVGKNINGKQILKDISLSYFYGAKIGVLGLNGSGKSTLLRILAGKDSDFQGETHIQNGYTIGYLEQEPLLNEEKTVKEIVSEAVSNQIELLQEFEDISARFAEDLSDTEMNNLISKQGEIQEKIDHLDAWDLDSKLEMAMNALRCPDSKMKIRVLSGGEKRRVALCRLLLQKPDILLLDEPTNHLDAETIAWLEHHLHTYQGTVIAITHDRYFLDNVAGWILELDRGEGIPWKGNYSSWLDQKEKRLALEDKKEDKRQKTLKNELEWIKMSPKARQTKAKSRITSYENLLSQEIKERQKDMQIFIPVSNRLGNKVIRVSNLTKAYGEKLLFENLNFDLPPGGIVGVIGPNGSGKTTLFNLITNKEKPDSGAIEIGTSVEIACAEQFMENCDPSKNIWETISDGYENIMLGNKEVNSRAYVSRFNFSGKDQSKLMKHLSGGEKHRVQLAKMLKSGANVLLLDEPTNDLDVNTIRSMEEALSLFGGCAVVVSHDRWFLDRTCTHILAFEGNSSVIWFEGNFSEYERDKKKRLGTDSLIPKRIKYRHFSR